MKTNRQPLLLFTILVATAVTLLLMTPGTRAQGPGATPAPARALAPQKSNRTIAPYPGIYIFLDKGESSPSDYPFLTGANMTFFWQDIELSDQYFDWSPVDDWLETQSRLGKAANIGFSVYDGRCCGGHTIPPWMLWEDETSVVRCDTMQWAIPRYWGAYYQKQYKEFIQAFAQRYDNDPRVAWIEIGTGIFGEAKPSDNSDFLCLYNAGLTPEVWVQTSMDIMDIFAQAFQNTPLLYQYAPAYIIREGGISEGSLSQRRILTDYAASLGMGVKNNGLTPDMDFALVDNPAKSYHKSGIWDPIYTWWPSVPIGWESYATQKCLDTQTGQASAGITMWCVYAGLASHADYFVFSRDLVTDPHRAPYLEFAQHYLGAEIENTDSVWVALRETEFNFYPARGNYSFWLYQNDDVVGGQTVPQWHVSGTKEGRYTRRTDRSSGNNNMYFDVANAWMYQNQSATVQIEVIYWDQGTDTWSLYYDAADNAEKLAGTVHKHDSGEWLTHTFTLPDARFSDRLPGGGTHAGSDFYLASNDFDDTFHRVRVFRDDVAPTPTPPPIVTATPTPTPGPGAPTPTPEPKYMLLRQGYQGYSGVEDTWIGTWCANNSDTAGNLNHGQEQILAVRANGDPAIQSICSALLRFDTRRIPAGSKIVEAKVIVKGVRQTNAARIYLNAFDLNKPWNENQATWFQAHDGLLWDAEGADGPSDHPDLPWDTAYLGGVAEYEHSAWASAYITPLVQRWVDHPDRNFGMMLRPYANKVEWHLAASNYPIERYRPMLEVRYYLPDEIPPTPTPTPTPPPTATPVPDTGIISGIVFHDRQQSGTPHYNPGIENVRLELINQSTNSIHSVVTNNRGFYQFENIAPDTYILKEIQPIGWTPAQPVDSVLLTVMANQSYTFNFGHQALITQAWLPLVMQSP
jgi:hypothetical protein